LAADRSLDRSVTVCVAVSNTMICGWAGSAV
jgi:hypothetical protein